MKNYNLVVAFLGVLFFILANPFFAQAEYSLYHTQDSDDSWRYFMKTGGTYASDSISTDNDGNPWNNYKYPGNIDPYNGSRVTSGDWLQYLQNYFGSTHSDWNDAVAEAQLNPASTESGNALFGIAKNIYLIKLEVARQRYSPGVFNTVKLNVDSNNLLDCNKYGYVDEAVKNCNFYQKNKGKFYWHIKNDPNPLMIEYVQIIKELVDPLIDYKTSAYENIRNRKIYRDVLNSMNLNSSTICEKLGFLGENLIMCQAYRTDILNKESWKLIDRVNTAVNTQTAVVSTNSKASVLYNVPEVKDGALVRAAGSDDIYIVKYVGSKKFKRLILSPSVFNSYGHLKWVDVLNIDKSILDSFTASNLVRAVNDPKVYVLSPNGDTGERHWVSSESAFKNLGLDWDSIYEINEKDRDSYVNSSSY